MHQDALRRSKMHYDALRCTKRSIEVRWLFDEYSSQMILFSVYFLKTQWQTKTKRWDWARPSLNDEISPHWGCVCVITFMDRFNANYVFLKLYQQLVKPPAPHPPGWGKFPTFFSEKLKWAAPLSSRWEQNTSELLNVFNLCIVRMMQAWTALYALYNQYRSDVKLHPCKTFRL